MKVNEPGRHKLERQNLGAVGEAYKAIFLQTPCSKENFDGSGFSAKRNLICHPWYPTTGAIVKANSWEMLCL